MEKIHELVEKENVVNLINSRMLEIMEWLPNPEEEKAEIDSASKLDRCLRCEMFEIALSDCHICENRFCSRCVWYFMLPKGKYKNKEKFHGLVGFLKCQLKHILYQEILKIVLTILKIGSIQIPLTVCWACHDICIFKRLFHHPTEDFVGSRKKLIFKKIKFELYYLAK